LLLTAQRVTAGSDGTTVPGMAVHPERPKQPPPR
jgi:hypothetical protein